MAKSPSLEVDFFSMEKKLQESPPPAFQRRRSFRDIQGVITKMNPEVVKSVIGISGNPNFSPLSISHPKISDLRLIGGEENTTPLTIFYNGVVSVFEVSPSKAQDILSVAQEILPKSAENLESSSYTERNFLESLNGDLPISRKNSLQRFLKKRKERLVTVSPYNFPAK